ncbi:MAG: putative lipid II flippase FtsW [Chthoniobacterales bacterium]
MQRNSVYILLLAVCGLIVLGVVMLFSTSAFAQDSHGDMYYFVKRQSIWLVAGCILCAAAAISDYRIWQKTWPVWFGVSIILLILCFVPHIGMKLNGAHRWINLGKISFQPSEVGKIAIVIFLAWWFTKYEKTTGKLLDGLIKPLLIISVPLLLIGSERDLGTAALIATMAFSMMFISGSNLRWLLPFVILGMVALVFVTIHIPERAARIMAFLHPELHKLDKGLQQYQGLIAFGSGGVQGLGLGEGRQKFLYLPYAHTDFIFPMIGEELGLRFTLLTVFGFLIIALCGCLIASNARDRFGILLGFGFTILMTFQAAINIGMTLSLLPNKGMPLPFISYGGSNLLMCLFMVGTLISIHRHGRLVETSKSDLLLAARMNVRGIK